MYGTIKNQKLKDNSAEESRPIGQAVSLGRLSSHFRVTTDRESATWSARALGRVARSKNQRHSPIRLESWNAGSLCGRGVEVVKSQGKGKWMYAASCIQEVRWKNEGTRFLGVFGRRYKLWWSKYSAGRWLKLW